MILGQDRLRLLYGFSELELEVLVSRLFTLGIIVWAKRRTFPGPCAFPYRVDTPYARIVCSSFPTQVYFT